MGVPYVASGEGFRLKAPSLRHGQRGGKCLILAGAVLPNGCTSRDEVLMTTVFAELRTQARRLSNAKYPSIIVRVSVDGRLSVLRGLHILVDCLPILLWRSDVTCRSPVGDVGDSAGDVGSPEAPGRREAIQRC